MNKEQVIEEMQNTLIKIARKPIIIDGLEDWSDVIAEELYNADYRKISEVEKWTIREISEGIDSIIEDYERLKRLGYQHDDKWRFDNLVSDIRDFMKEYEEQKNA